MDPNMQQMEKEAIESVVAWGQIFTTLGVIILVGLVGLFIYDRYIQRKHQLLINYPVIGRFRYFFELLREPLRQYFAEENFFESRDKVDWVYKAAKDKPNYISFSVSQPLPKSRFILKHVANVLNEDEVDEELTVTFGPNRREPFVAKSPIIRSAMSDGALSPKRPGPSPWGRPSRASPTIPGREGLPPTTSTPTAPT
jgi:hypothetical protein